ncbi:MAG: sulfotransferase domain-containing protein [Bacteroidota bacterium]
MKKIAPGFLIGGFQKCGTSTLFHWLSQHPQIEPASKKEIDFFWVDSQYNKGNKWYLSHFKDQDNASEKQLSFEATPTYLFSEKAARRIFQFNEHMKFLVLLRNPVERAYSQFMAYQRKRSDQQKLLDSANKYDDPIHSFFKQLKNPSVFTDFDSHIQQEINALKTGIDGLMPFLVEQGLYAIHLKKYFAIFPKENFCFIEIKEMVQDPKMVLENIFHFLGLTIPDFQSWDLESRNIGDYTSLPKVETLRELFSFYAEHNQSLFDLIGKSYGWEVAFDLA